MPHSEKRSGECANCGACCSLPARCPFLRYNEAGGSFCSIHSYRPMNCRKYPRTQEEFITEDTCGYRFE
jgi:Fe-S-cluster containining protein